MINKSRCDLPDCRPWRAEAGNLDRPQPAPDAGGQGLHGRGRDHRLRGRGGEASAAVDDPQRPGMGLSDGDRAAPLLAALRATRSNSSGWCCWTGLGFIGRLRSSARPSPRPNQIEAATGADVQRSFSATTSSSASITCPRKRRASRRCASRICDDDHRVLESALSAGVPAVSCARPTTRIGEDRRRGARRARQVEGLQLLSGHAVRPQICQCGDRARLFRGAAEVPSERTGLVDTLTARDAAVADART